MTFKCIDGCKADCCGVVPINKRIFKKHLKDVQRPIMKLINIGYDTLPLSENALCVFLANGKCAIYQDRPLICKLYGTIDKLPCRFVRPDGTIRDEVEVKIISDNIISFVDDGIKRLNSIKPTTFQRI